MDMQKWSDALAQAKNTLWRKRQTNSPLLPSATRLLQKTSQQWIKSNSKAQSSSLEEQSPQSPTSPNNLPIRDSASKHLDMSAKREKPDTDGGIE